MEEEIKKGTIIYGPKNSGKSQKAIDIVKDKLTAEVVFITDYNELDPFVFFRCKESTSTIVIDELKPHHLIENLFSIVTEGLLVETPGSMPFTIYPEVIIVLSSEITHICMNSSLVRRFNFIYTNNK